MSALKELFPPITTPTPSFKRIVISSSAHQIQTDQRYPTIEPSTIIANKLPEHHQFC